MIIDSHDFQSVSPQQENLVTLTAIRLPALSQTIQKNMAHQGTNFKVSTILVVVFRSNSEVNMA